MPDLFAPLTFPRGRPMPNRLALAPLTNRQSHDDGRLSEAERAWLVRRARGGFGLTMTCASHVQPSGQGFGGQLAIHSDDFLDGLTSLAADLRATGTLGVVQLHHAGARADRELVADRVSASEVEGARALELDEVHRLREDFVAAAVRAERAGFDGVEVHGAHGYVLTQFLSAETNQRTDAYGGSPENRARLLLEVLAGIRAACGPDFQLGLRLSVERFGLRTLEMRELAAELFGRGELDYLDLSLWDVTKYSVDDDAQDQPLLELFAELPRGGTRLGAAGKVRTPADAAAVLERGADFAFVGRAAILHGEYAQLARDADWEPVPMPVDVAHVAGQDVSPAFVDYLRTFRGFLAP
ncbi:NADH:flavin oxidoreductase [Trujillonella endophytica]|uniref:2,4-dienoyl-CoA reductase n=1 Tax=Trujillonella endophytica TaxID=673521 RepID=A0A1H8WHM2_9ACTN|nr:NADH:flavin oxidoreductase [Trujillella endophytica]SEP27109.1 2,4-dienoyl-CoA reductase [Trujillella endophytica]